MSAVSASPSLPAQLDRARVQVIFGALMLVLLLAALDQTIVATALPTIVGDLGGLSHLSWVTSAFLLAQTAVTPLYGKLGDLYGRKRILQSAVMLFLVGSVLCGLSRSMIELIAFRAVQGLGAGGLIVLVQSVVGDIVPPRERGRYQGLFGAVFGVASVAGPLLGGVIVDSISWRWIFYVNLPVGLVALVVLGATLPSTGGRTKPTIDYLGAGVLASALSAIVLVASLGGTSWAWAARRTILVAAAGILLLGVFVLIERRASRAGAAATSDAQPRVRGGEHPVADRRLRHVRVDHVPAPLLPNRRRGDADRRRVAADSDDGGAADACRSSRGS